MAWPRTAGANSGVESVASEAPANKLKLRRVISVIVTPPWLIWSLCGLEIERERGNILVIQPAGDCLHDRIRQRFRPVGPEDLHEMHLTQPEDVWNRAAGLRCAVTGHAF